MCVPCECAVLHVKVSSREECMERFISTNWGGGGGGGGIMV